MKFVDTRLVCNIHENYRRAVDKPACGDRTRLRVLNRLMGSTRARATSGRGLRLMGILRGSLQGQKRQKEKRKSSALNCGSQLVAKQPFQI